MALERGSRLTTQHREERGVTTVAKKTKVRTTNLPGKVIEVERYELIDLERQGLIHSREGDENWPDDKPKTKAPDKAATTKGATT